MPLILAVDDTPTNLMLVQAALGRAGYQVECAGSAEEAQGWLTEHRPDLILLDIQMPEMDGLTFTRILKSNPDTASIPVIAFTALAMLEDEKNVLAAGCDGYITKPIDVLSLGDRVAEFLRVAGRPA